MVVIAATGVSKCWVKEREAVGREIHPEFDEEPIAAEVEICEYCKRPVVMMCQIGTEVCSQECANLAANILFSDPEKAKKFGAKT